MPKLIDLKGKIFNSWKVLRRLLPSPREGVTLWECRCACGVKKAVASHNLIYGFSTNCGGHRKGPIKHGASVGGVCTLTYSCWRAMRSRVFDKKNFDYWRYGGRGITVCDRWLEFSNFLEDMGERPTAKHSIDRYPDGNGNYEPGNCRWATRKQQVENLPQNQKGYKHRTRHGKVRLGFKDREPLYA